MTDAVVALAPASGMTAAACIALGVSRASVQRRRARLTAPPAIPRPRPRSARALTAPQQQIVLDLLHAPRFADQAPAEIYASLLDHGRYHCSIRTMSRILDRHDEVRERRAQLRHPVYQKPELLAERPNQSLPPRRRYVMHTCHVGYASSPKKPLARRGAGTIRCVLATGEREP